MAIDPYVAAGMARGFKQATGTLATIMEKRKERKQEDELWGLQKKKLELEIKEMELSDFDPEVIQAKKDKLKADSDLQKAKAATANLELEDARKTTKERLKDLTDQANAIRTYDQGKQDGLTLPGTAPEGGGGEGGLSGLELPPGWSIDATLGGDTDIKFKTPGELTAKQQQDVGIEKQKVLSVLKQGYYTETDKGETFAYDLNDRGAAENYVVQNFDADVSDPDIQQALSQYKPTEEVIDETSWFERAFQGQKFPQKTKFGFTYEKRDDGKWHKVSE